MSKPESLDELGNLFHEIAAAYADALADETTEAFNLARRRKLIKLRKQQGE